MNTAPTDAGAAHRILGARYLLEERIASGGMATVWRAHDETLARTVAVKVLHEHLAADDALRERFRREAVAAAKLAHPGIVGIYDTGERSDGTYLVMEYVEGETLRDLLAARGRLDITEAAAIGVDVAHALAYAHHRGLVHRDVKPANILLADDGSVKVADFGIAKVAESAHDLTQTGTVLGTAAYVAPEQVRGDPVDGGADQYSLACVLYEAITGRRPFEAESAMAMATRRLSEDPLPLRAVRPDTPRALDEVLMRALARDPVDRHDDIMAFADALRGWAPEDTTVLPPNATAEEPAQPEEQDAGAALSFLRSEGTWLAPVVALLVVAATLVAVGLATGVLESDRIPNLTATDRQEDSSAPIGEPGQAPTDITPERLSAFDPAEVEGFVGGDEVENDDLLVNLVDGDPSTEWRTERYDDPQFGNLKPGVGVVLDLGGAHQLSDAVVRTPTPGITYEVRVADEAHRDVDDWTIVASVEDAAETEEITLDGVNATYVLLYVLPALHPVDGGALAAFSLVEFRGTSP